MDGGRDGLTGRLHVGVALLAAWLIFTSPWLAMFRRMPKHPGALDLAHVALGFLALLLALFYVAACTRQGRWRLYFPWLAGQGGAALRDLGGLLRGRIPSAEGGGLFGLVEGLVLLALLATGATGAGWFLAQGSDTALAFRSAHAIASQCLVGLAVAHIATVSLHLIELIRD